MVSVISSLSPLHQQQLQGAAAAIAAAVQPEKIICFGMRMRQQHSWSCFTAHTPSATLHGDLLVIIRETEKSKREVIAQSMRKHSHEGIILSAQVHSLGAVVMALQNNHPFFTRVLSEGEVLYDKGTPLLLYPGVASETKDHHATEQEEAIKNIQRAEGFVQAAAHLNIAGMKTLVLFLLHQATEQAASAIIKKYMSYLPATHRLGRLLELTENCSPEAVDIFQRGTEAERKRFALLEQAYVDARYSSCYTVSNETVIILQEQVKEFVHCASTLIQK